MVAERGGLGMVTTRRVTSLVHDGMTMVVFNKEGDKFDTLSRFLPAGLGV